MPTITGVIADRQYARMLESNPNAPGVLITLTATVADDTGGAAPDKTPIYWDASGFNLGVVFFFNEDNSNPTQDKGTSYTSNGRAVIKVGATRPVIGTVFAALTERTDHAAPSFDATAGGPDFQLISVCTFDNDDGTLNPPTISGKSEDGPIQLAVVDGTQSPAPIQTGIIDNALPLNPSPGGNQPTSKSSFVIWACSGADTTGVGNIIYPPTNWDGQALNITIPYAGFSEDGNQLAYLFYDDATALWSTRLVFQFSGTPLLRPDDLPLPTNPKYKPPQYVLPNPFGDSTIGNIPLRLGNGDFDKNGNITFAIPAPTNPDATDAYSPRDVISIGFYLNGWDTTAPNELQGTVISYELSGNNFQPNYLGSGHAYIPLILTQSQCTGFGHNGSTGGFGYLWVQYTYNGFYALPPNGPLRIDFAGKRPPPARTPTP